MDEIKLCEQCQTCKDLSAFHKRKNKTDGRMKICAECYKANLRETQQNQRDNLLKWKLHQQELEEKSKRAQAEKGRQEYLIRLQAMLEHTKTCQNCQQEFPTNKHGFLVVPFLAFRANDCQQCHASYSLEICKTDPTQYGCSKHKRDTIIQHWHGGSKNYCPFCHEEQRKQNRQSYPLCPLCGKPTRAGEFLREYQGYELDIIRVCCTACIDTFHALPESEQLTLLRQAMVHTYGETAFIYALQYDSSSFYHHIGRTKRLRKRMSQYRQKWHRPIYAYHVLEHVTFGPLSMERESRWMLHALKHGWPIDNFDIFDPDKHNQPGEQREEEPSHQDLDHPQRQIEIHENHLKIKEYLTKAVKDIEPLTAPFESIQPLLKYFFNTLDTSIVNWFVTQHENKKP